MVPLEIVELFRTKINPQLVEHGGRADPLDYQDGVLWIRMGGACRGCLSQDATVGQVIEKTLRESCQTCSVEKVTISDTVDPELWDMAQRILKGEKML